MSSAKFPINFVKVKWILFFAIFLIALGIRSFRFGQVPHGMTWDEAAIGYNGYAIAKVHRDEWLRFMPVSFKSFGDFKAPLSIYVNGIFTYTLGLKLWVVRLPFLIGSMFTVVGFYLLLQELFIKTKLKENWSKCWPIIGMAILAVSPWHLHYSRAGFESGLALMFAVWMVWSWFKFLNSKKQTGKFITFSLFILFAVLSIYTYHSSKMVIPIFGLWLVWLERSKFVKLWRWYVGGGIFGLLGLSPFLYDTLFGQGGARLTQTSVLATEGNLFQKMVLILSQFLDHWTPAFLIFGETPTLRHGSGAWGVILPTTFVLFITGVLVGIYRFFDRKNKQKAWNYWFALGFGWWVIGLLPAAIGFESPHSNRVLLALPGLIITSLFGLSFIYQYLSSKKWLNVASGSHGEDQIVLKMVVGCLILFHLLFSAVSINHYFTNFAANSAPDFQDGYLEVFEYIIPYEQEEREFKPEKIVFTNEYGQPYIYALFARKTNPIWYNGGSLIKFEFKDVNIGDLQRKNTIVVSPPLEDVPLNWADHIVYGSDSKPRFLIFLLDEKN